MRILLKTASDRTKLTDYTGVVATLDVVEQY